MSTEPDGVEHLADRLAGDLAAAFGADLLTLAAHGSWVFGDFCPGRSDLDLLAVLARDPDSADLARLAHLYPAVERDAPQWTDVVCWAERWWTEGGRDDEDAPPDVSAFVAAMAEEVDSAPGEG
jgi:hypothetical protein